MPPPSEEPGRSINPGSLEQFEAISDGFLVLDRDYRFVFINAAGERIFGRSRDDMIGRHVTEVVPEAVGSDCTAAVARVMATGEPVLHEAYFAPWDRWMENRVYPTPEGVWIFFRDVTERKRAVEELRESASGCAC